MRPMPNMPNMPNMDPRQMLQQMMQQNPNMFQNNPQAQRYAEIIMNNDTQKGEELARNICASFGVSPEEGVQQSQQYTQQMMQQMMQGFNPNFRGR